MTLFIDDRVGAIEIATHICVDKELVHLDFADFAFVGNGPEGPALIGIERKEIRDLIQSLISGRLSGYQLEGLLSNYDYVYLLVEGLTKIDDEGYITIPKGKRWMKLRMGDRYVTDRFISNYVNTLTVFCGVIVKFTTSRRNSGLWLSNLYKWWQKDWNKHRAFSAFKKLPPPKLTGKFGMYKPTLVHRIIKEIDGVGWEKGKTIAEKYDNLMDLMLAEERELRKLPGIGPKLAHKIITSLRGE